MTADAADRIRQVRAALAALDRGECDADQALLRIVQAAASAGEHRIGGPYKPEVIT